MTKTSTVLIRDIGWAEGPRWHDDRLYFSDIYGDRTVQTVGHDGTRSVVAEVPTHPSGLGWMPDGDLLVVSMDDNAVLRFPREGGVATVHADLSSLAVAVNDMCVLPSGVAYVGDNGFDYETSGPRPGRIIRVEPDGTATVAAEGFALPNGIVATSDSARLVVAETLGGRLTGLAINADGSLRDREILVAFDERAHSSNLDDFFDMVAFVKKPVAPDGICLGHDDTVWVGNPFSTLIRCYDQAGTQVDEVELKQGGVAPALGGPDGNTLFVATGDPTKTFNGRTSWIESCVL